MTRYLLLSMLVACTSDVDLSPATSGLSDPSGLAEPDESTTEQAISVGPEVRVSNDTTMAAQDQPTAATVRTRPGHLLIAAHSYPPGATSPVDGVAAYWRSNDGGRTFPVRGIVPGLVRGSGGAFEGASDLSAACNDAVECYLASFVYDLAVSRTAIAVSRSNDAGATWQPPVLVIDETDPALFNERCSIAVDGASVYVSWIRVDSTGGLAVPIYVAASHDHGASFTTPRPISDAVANVLNDKPATVVDHHGRVFVAYENFLLDDPDKDRQLIQVSRDGGATFEAAHQIDFVYDTFEALPPASFRINSFPQLAVDPIGDALIVAFTDTRRGGPDVVVTRSTDAGRTWSALRRVTDTPIGAQIQHALPALACSPLGVCAVSFYSSRNDPAGLLMDEYIAPIIAGVPGRNTRVSTHPTNPNVQFGGSFIGDYTALVLDAASAHPVWTGTHIGLPDPQQDIFTSRVTAW